MADIELVIKIPEDVFKRTMFYREFRDLNDCVTTIKALEKAVPLPKGHGRLIDADKTILKICGSSCGCHLEECGRDKPCFSVTMIESAPTIIEADKESEDKE